MLISTRRRTWNPRGCTPIVRYNYKHDRLSAIAALSVAAQRARLGLYLQLRQDNFKAVHVAKFLRLLLSHLRGHVVLLWDGGQIHKGPAINAVCHAFPRLHLERFPGYAQPHRAALERLQAAYREQHPAWRAGHSTRSARQRPPGPALSGQVALVRARLGLPVSGMAMSVLLLRQRSIINPRPSSRSELLTEGQIF
jgi:hypothetical protein